MYFHGAVIKRLLIKKKKACKYYVNINFINQSGSLTV